MAAATETGTRKSSAGKISKKDHQQLVDRAKMVGLDVDPENFDRAALASALDIADAVDPLEAGTPIEIAGPAGDVFERGEFVRRLRSGAIRIKNEMGSVEIPLSMVGSIAVASEPEPAPAAKPSRAARKTSPSPVGETRPPREGSTLWAAIEVLKRARTPMPAADVFAKIKERKLAPGLKGKTPEATVAAALNVAAARGQHGITRPKPGRFALQKAGK